MGRVLFCLEKGFFLGGMDGLMFENVKDMDGRMDGHLFQN